ncbi:hypothetical protein EDD86DRAFT_213630 [Gorgonomyces haynaldii]|nr:hypothetical protein EDD86DRAFT_213630 [Gorgonomyces haynaldii]
MTKSWIDVNVDKIVLDQVYMNGLHVLRRLEIQNLCNHPVLVKLRSSLGNQINFQLQNENLPLLNLITSPSVASVGDMDDDLQLQYSTLQKEQFLDESQYNQLFNYVNYVDQVLIPPNQSQSIVLLFLPEKTFESEDDYNNCFDIDGLVFFFAYKADAVVESIDEGNTPPDYQHSVKFRSRVCRSYMWTDIDSAGIIFDDCVVGQTYFRDFTIWNRSEIDLHWVLNEADLLSRKWLEFSDYDSGGPLDFAPIPAYSPKRIRITFKPKEPGDFVYDILIENENDASNTIETRLHASVRSFLREEMLIINTGNFLDFSDCYSGMWKKKEIVLRNVSDAPLEIKFSCDDPNVVFQLRTDDTQTQTSQRSKRTLRSTEHINLFQSDPDLSLQDPSVQSHISRTVSDLSLSYESLSSVDSSHQREIESQAESSQVDLYIDRTEHGNEEIARIDEILMRPGRERHVEVCYRPQREQATQDFRGGKLVKRMFKVSIQYCHPRSKHALEYYNVQCVARVCTTFIEVSPSTLNFGDTDVGTQKTSSIFIKNCSELSAKVELQYVSKVLNTTRGEIVIPPRQTIEAKVEIYPRKVNPNYRKQITVANLFNRDNDCVVEIISTNVDKQHITFHSLYYHIVTSSATNFLDFGSVVLNAPVLRTFTIENISKELVMSISSSLPEDIQIYVKAPSTEPPEIPTTMERREKLLESIDRRKSKWNPSDSPLSNASTNSLGNVKQETEKELAQYLDLASSGRSSPVRRQFGPMDVRSQFIRDKRRSQRAIGSQTELSREPSEMEGMDDMDLLKIKLDSLIQLLEKDNGTVPVFTKASSEERYVKRQQFLFRELSNYIRTQALIPISEITIPQNKSVQIILIMKPSIEKNPYIQVFHLKRVQTKKDRCQDLFENDSV